MENKFIVELINLNYEKIISLSNKYRLEYNDNNDLVQETLLKILRNKDKFKEGTNFLAWVTTIMYHCFIDKFRINKKTRTLEITEFIIKSKSGPDYAIIDKNVFKIINTLPVRFKESFILMIEGCKYVEISERLNLPLNTVRSNIHLSRKILKQKIEEY